MTPILYVHCEPLHCAECDITHTLEPVTVSIDARGNQLISLNNERANYCAACGGALSELILNPAETPKLRPRRRRGRKPGPKPKPKPASQVDELLSTESPNVTTLGTSHRQVKCPTCLWIGERSECTAQGACPECGTAARRVTKL